MKWQYVMSATRGLSVKKKKKKKNGLKKRRIMEVVLF